MRIKSYQEMFKGLAEKHSLGFSRIFVSAEPNPGYELGELLKGYKQALRFPLLVLESYEATYQDKRSDNRLKVLQGAFLVLSGATSKSDRMDVKVQHIDDSEAFAESILNDLRTIHKADRTRRHFSIQDVELAPILDLQGGKYHGVRVDFSLTVSVSPIIH